MTETFDTAPTRRPRRSSAQRPSSDSGEASPRARSARQAPQLKLQIDFPGGARLGPGKVRLLELIETEGSLSKAAVRMNISYRRAWLFVQQINRAFDEPAVATPEHGHGGGPSTLTPFGHELVRHYRLIETAAHQSGAQILKWLDRHKTGRDLTDGTHGDGR